MPRILPPLSQAWPGEFALLRELLLSFSGPGREEGKRALGALAPASLEKFRGHRLTPWLYWEVARWGWEEYVAPAVLAALRQDYVHALKGAAREEEEAHQVIRSLIKAEADFIVLKGVDLRLRLYGDAAVRPLADLDVLVSPGQFPRAQAALADRGYRLSYWYCDPRPGYWRRFGHAREYWRPQSPLLVDLHWQIAAVGDFYRLPYHLLRERTVPGDFQGLPIRLLAPEHLLIHLCLRGLSDRFASVFHFLDLALALSRLQLDWPRLGAEACRFRCQRPVYLILREMAELFPRSVPPPALAELGRYLPPWYERLALSPGLRYLTLNFPMLYRHYPMRDWGNYYAGKFWPRPEYLAANLGKPDRVAYLRLMLANSFALPAGKPDA